MPTNLEPLFSDLRMARVEREVRRRFPLLPPEVTFLSYYQEPTERTTADGLVVPVEAQAVLSLVITNPRHPQFEKIIAGRRPWSIWRANEAENRHSAEVMTDQAYHIFCRLAPDMQSWYENTQALI